MDTSTAQRPMVIAHHLIWTVYGWWLPNDPRGSTSDRIASAAIASLGELHFGRRQCQPARAELRDFHQRSAGALKHDRKELNREEILSVATGLGDAIAQNRYTCYACAIMPDHVHMVIRKHKQQAEEMLVVLQNVSKGRVLELDTRERRHPIWTKGGWKGFLDRPSAVRRVIRYVEQNPLEIGLPKQHWPFVTAYDDWPFHPGHHVNSPYARRLRAYLAEQHR